MLSWFVRSGVSAHEGAVTAHAELPQAGAAAGTSVVAKNGVVSVQEHDPVTTLNMRSFTDIIAS